MSQPGAMSQTGATEITLVEPLPGLTEHTRFTFAAVDQAPELFTLRANGTGEAEQQPRLFLLDPREFFPDYRPEIDADTLARLGTADPAVLVVLHPATGDLPHTANLLAPVLINLTDATAMQVVLEGSPWPVRTPLATAA